MTCNNRASIDLSGSAVARTLLPPHVVRWLLVRSRTLRRRVERSLAGTRRPAPNRVDRWWPFFTHAFSLFPDTTLLTPQETETVPPIYIERLSLSDFFEKLPYTCASKCKICGRVVSNLRNHYLTHNPGNYVCPMCGCRRSRLDNLKLHIKQKHPEIQILPKYGVPDVQTWTIFHRVFLRCRRGAFKSFRDSGDEGRGIFTGDLYPLVP